MTSLRILRRQEKRLKLVNKYRRKRLFLKTIIKSKFYTFLEKERAQILLQKLPKDSSSCRLRNRCFLTGRGKGVYKYVGLCRNMFRFYAMRGDIPGIRKSSW